MRNDHLHLLAISLAFLMGTALSSAPRWNGSPSPHPEPPQVVGPPKAEKPIPEVLPMPKADEPKQNLVLTDDTAVSLDGKAVKFQDVPGDADVVSLAVAADKRTIIRIAFKTKGKQ